MEVGLGTINYVNDICNNDSTTLLAYSDYTDSIFQVQASTPILGTASAQEFFAGEPQVDIYVDWNNNGDLEDVGESVTAVNDGLGGYNYVLAPPAGLTQGLKRMRVRVWYPVVEIVPIGACGQSVWGEVEDYSIFYTDPAKPIPACATGFIPANGASNVCIQSTLKWRKTPTATTYKVSLKNKSSNTILFTDSVTADTTIFIGSFLLPNTNYAYTVIPTNANGSAMNCDTVAFSTSVNFDPSVSLLPVGDTVVICNSSTLPLMANASSGTAPYSYTWTGNRIAYLSATNADAINFKGSETSVDTNKYFVTVSDANNCRSKDSIIIRTTAKPIIESPILSKSMICEGELLTITVNSIDENFALGYTIEDSTGTASWANANLNQTGITTFETSLLSVKTAYRLNILTEGCTVTSGISTVNVNAAPAKPVVTVNGPSSFCSGDSTSLIVINYATNLLWSNALTNDTVKVKLSGSYTVTYTGTGGCSSTSNPQVITVNSLPAKPVVTMIGGLTSCQNSPTILVPI